MFSTNARKAMLVVAGAIVGFLVTFAVGALFNLQTDSSFGVRLGLMIVLVLAGAIAGLILEKKTRAGYQAALKNNPALRKQLDNAIEKPAFGKRFGWYYIITIFYLVYRIAGLYLFFTLGYTLSPAAHLQLIIETVFDGVVTLVLLWLYFERGNSTPNVKRFFLISSISFLIVVVLDCVLRLHP